jgi:lipopolysaccharide heptosyltransferase II
MPAEKILVIRLSSIGDIILTTPLVRRLRRAFPEAQIDYLVKPAFKQLLAHNPRINTVLTTDQQSLDRYDVIIDLQNNFRSKRLRSGKAKTLFFYRKQNWKKWLLVQFKVNLFKTCTPVPERYIEAAEELGLKDDGLGCELFVGKDAQAYASQMLTGEFPKLAVCYGAKHFTKQFPVEKFARVLNDLLDRHQIDVLLLGGKEDAALGEEIFRRIEKKDRVKDFSGKCSLMETAALLSASDAVLTNDTGLMHMASAFGKPMVVLFGSSVEAFGFAPYRVPSRILQVDGLSCRPCSHIGRSRCPKGHFKCMNDISDASVTNAVEKALKKGSG